MQIPSTWVNIQRAENQEPPVFVLHHFGFLHRLVSPYDTQTKQCQPWKVGHGASSLVWWHSVSSTAAAAITALSCQPTPPLLATGKTIARCLRCVHSPRQALAEEGKSIHTVPCHPNFPLHCPTQCACLSSTMQLSVRLGHNTHGREILPQPVLSTLG